LHAPDHAFPENGLRDLGLEKQHFYPLRLPLKKWQVTPHPIGSGPPGGVISPEAVELWAKRGLDGVGALSLQLLYE